MISSKTARLLSLVLLAALLPLLGLYGLLMKISIPNADGGMEPTVAMVCYFAFTFLFAALIIVALNFSRQLAKHGKGETLTP